MAQIRISHPWNPGYAIPDYVMKEPDGRGTFTTKWAPRGHFVGLPKSARNRTAGYAIPKHVLAEPIGRGVFAGKYIPRRTVGVLAPDMLQSANHSLKGDSLGATDVAQEDPISVYGQKAAQIVLVEMNKVPPQDRSLMMRRILTGVDPALITKVNSRLKANKAKGMAQGPALRQALEESFKEGLTREFARIGRGQKGPGAVSLALGLDIGGSIKGLFSGHVSAAKKIAGVGCTVATHPAGSLAAGATAAGAGVSPDDAQAGVAIAANLCSQPGGGVAPGGFPWVPVALVGGAALVAILLVTRD